MCSVPAVGLDQYLRPGQHIDFIKMDIEGGEVKAIPGMIRLLREARPLVMLELHEGAGSAVDTLLTAGYRIYDLALSPLADRDIHPECLNHCLAVPVERAITAVCTT